MNLLSDSNLLVVLFPLLGTLLGTAIANPLEPYAFSTSKSIESNHIPKQGNEGALKPRAVKELPCNQWKWGTGGILHCCQALDKNRKPFSIGVNCKPVDRNSGAWHKNCPEGVNIQLPRKDLPLYCCSKVRTVNGLVCYKADHLPKGWFVPDRPISGPCWFKDNCPNGGRGGDLGWLPPRV